MSVGHLPASAKLVLSLMSRSCLTRKEYESRIGTEVGISTWITLDQPRIDDFAAATLDRQFLHVDPLAASRTQFGGTIAHGFLSLSLLSAMAQESLPVIEHTQAEINFGFNSIRFVAPVRSGKRVRGRFELKAFRERSPGLLQLTVGVTMEIEAEPKPALVAEWLVLYRVRN
jgi:acyl dehydratase